MLISFREWLQKQTESSPQTRLMKGIWQGNYPPTASPFTHSTPKPWELKSNEKSLRKGRKKKKGKKASSKKKLKGAHKPKKVSPPKSFNGGLDQWIQAADNLEKELYRLKYLRQKDSKRE